MSDIVQIIESALKRTGLSASKASMLAVNNPALVKSIKNGSSPSFNNLKKLADVLGLELYLGEPKELVGVQNASIPLIGNIAAGGGDGIGDGQVIAYALDNGQKVSVPLGVSQEDLDWHGGLAAFRVTGASMQPVYDDGDLIYVYGRDPMRLRPENLIGKDCAVVIEGGVNDGAIYLKRLRRPDSGKRGLFNLESLNANFPTMIDVSVHNIMPVRHVKKAIS